MILDQPEVEAKEPNLEADIDISVTRPRKKTNLEGIMSYSKPGQKLDGSQVFQGTSLSALVNLDESLKLPNPSAIELGKKKSLIRAQELAQDIEKSYKEMMGLISNLQQETSMAIKTQDLEKEFNKVFARVKVISKL